MMRVFLQKGNPFADATPPGENFPCGKWPARWIAPASSPAGACAVCFQLEFTASEASELVLHVSADEHYDFMVDGELAGRGPVGGDRGRWFYDSYKGRLAAGSHLLEAIVYFWGGNAGGGTGLSSRISERLAFVLAAEGEWQQRLSTGSAPWRCRVTSLTVQSGGLAVPACRLPSLQSMEKAPETPIALLDSARHYDIANEYGGLPLLAPSPLPPMVSTPVVPAVLSEEARAWRELLQEGRPLRIPAGRSVRVLLSFPRYVCVWMEWQASGGAGAVLSCRWAEALLLPDGGKKRTGLRGDDRLTGGGDDFLADGSADQLFRTCFWQAGRYLEITVQGGREDLTIRGISFRETHYPLERTADFQCGDASIGALNDLCFRSLEMCSHDSFMDCPYYERLQYVGDARNEALGVYAFGLDDRLVQLALRMFAASRAACGLTLSRYPSQIRQIIPTFSLILPGMARESALWRGHRECHQELLPRWREILSFFRRRLAPEGIVAPVPGWNFIDWAEGWEKGYPPATVDQPSALVSLLYENALDDLAALEEYAGVAEWAAVWRSYADEAHEAILRVFYDSASGLFYDDIGHSSLSEHAQCLALLGGRLTREQRGKLRVNLLERNGKMTQCTVYFSHCLFEAYRLLEAGSDFRRRLLLWQNFTGQGFTTIPERPEPSRSDCHAWGAHPFFHFLASVLGIRPLDWEFSKVLVAPMRVWEQARGRMPHPRGMIEVAVEGGRCEVTLPAGVAGECRIGGQCWRIPADGRTHRFPM